MFASSRNRRHDDGRNPTHADSARGGSANPLLRLPSRFMSRRVDKATLPPSASLGVRAGFPVAEDISQDISTQESELIVAVFRTVILLVALFVPRVFGASLTYSYEEVALAAFACLYNIIVGLSCLYPHRYGLRRPFVIAVDMLIITLWMRLSGQWELFSLYYIVVIVAAMWFRVFGGVVAAIFSSFFFLYVWARLAGDPSAPANAHFPATYALNVALLLLVGCLVGYIAEAQERERQRRLEGQLLVANYQREIDLANQMQPLLIASQWLGVSENGVGETALSTQSTPESGRTFGARTSAAALLPDPDLQLGAAMKPAREFGGGDYFDVLPLKGNRTALCIADVSGKSVRAQARLPLLKYSLRALAPLYSDPGDLLTRLNETLAPDLQDDLFIGLCYVVLDPQREQIRWCNAGHIAPLVLSKDSSTPLETCGPALGPFPDIPFSSRTCAWTRGDRLLMFTDGLSDALSYGGSEDGEEQVRRLTLAMETEAWSAPQSVAQKLVDVAQAALDGDATLSRKMAGVLSPFTGEESDSESTHRDDITVIAAHFATHEVAEIAA